MIIHNGIIQGVRLVFVRSVFGVRFACPLSLLRSRPRISISASLSRGIASAVATRATTIGELCATDSRELFPRRVEPRPLVSTTSPFHGRSVLEGLALTTEACQMAPPAVCPKPRDYSPYPGHDRIRPAT
jgi:hypothetical protein